MPEWGDLPELRERLAGVTRQAAATEAAALVEAVRREATGR